MRIGIIGYYGFNNLGDELNLQCMMRNLTEQYQSVEFLIFSDCRKIEGDVHYHIVGLNYPLSPGARVQDIFNSCDLLIVGGGGMIYLGEFWFPFMDGSITAPYIIYRVGIDDRKIDTDAVNRYREMFLNAQEVTVRDGYSLNLCRKHLTDQAELVPEAIWNHPYREMSIKGGNVGDIGINLRSFSPEAYPVLKDFFSQLRKQGYKLHFIPCQVMNQNPNLNDNLHHRAAASAEDIIMPDDSSFRERCRLIPQMDVCIGMRLHFILLSLSQRVPVMALNYNNKVKGLMDEVLLSDYTVDLHNAGLPDSLEEVFRKILREKNNMKEQLDQRVCALWRMRQREKS
jgi:polysaccharide pyruvyl transferase WcaK-like protein